MSSKITADSVLDGDLTSNIKYSLEKTVNTQAAGEYPIEFRVMDRGGNTVYLKTQISISDKSYAGIDVKLKDYLIYLSVEMHLIQMHTLIRQIKKASLRCSRM